MGKINIENEIKDYFDYSIEGPNKNLPLWKKWYEGHDKGFHEYYIFNGVRKVKLNKKTLKMAKKSCEDWANLLLNENVQIAFNDSDKVFKILGNDFRDKANRLLETSFALSIGAFVETLGEVDVAVDEETGIGEIIKNDKPHVHLNYVNGTKIYPISFDEGNLVECAFASENTKTTDIQIHKLDENNEYIIINLVIDNITGETIETAYRTHSKKPLYQIIKPNVANNFDVDSPHGISIFANGIDSLKAIDNAYDSFDNEIVNGRKRIIVSRKFMNTDANGNSIEAFDPNDSVFYQLPEGIMPDENQIIKDVTTPLRINEISSALQEQLNIFSATCGFGKNYYTFGASGGGRPIQTATGIIAQNSDLYRSLRKHELLLESALKDMIEMVVFLNNEFTNDEKINIGEDGIKIDFDDSIIEDTEAEKTSDRTDVSNGVMSKVEYRMKWYGETEDVAIEKLNKFSLNELDIRVNSLLTALQSGAINPEEFVNEVYKNKDEATKKTLVEYIAEKLEQANQPISLENLNLDVTD